MKRLWLWLIWAALPLNADVLDQARDAEAAENYQRAIELYQQALQEHPEDAAPARALATLFSEKGLHDLALPQWQEVLRRDPSDSEAALALAQTWSYLDNNAQSVRVLEDTLARVPTSAEVLQALAWMLFKTENYPRGVSLIEDYLRDHPTDRSLEMTLGTLYSSLYDYGLSRVHYLRSIELASGSGAEERNFRAIAWYNLSLLEKSFFQFELADQAIQKSLAEEDRPAGALAWGELFQGKRDFAEARRLYEKAVQADETPLARFDLARLLQEFGFLDEAEAQIAQVEAHKDDTWIYNYGVTKDKVRRDIHELRADIHRARWFSLDWEPRRNPWEWLVWGARKVREGLLWWYHDQTWKTLLVRLSESSMAVRNSPDAWISLTLAERERPSLALKYLALIRNHELPKNPRSQGSYLVEEGIIRRDAGLLTWAESRLQTPWENLDRERTWAALVETHRGQNRTPEVRGLLAALYRLNPGALSTRGWALPVRLAVYGDPAARQTWQAAWAVYRWETGWDAEGGDRPGVTWSLDWNATPEGALWALRDADGVSVRTGTVRGVGDTLGALADVYRRVHAPR